MSVILSIASLSVNAIRMYFNRQKVEQLDRTIHQNDQIIAFEKYKYNQNKASLLQQANQYLHDGIYSSNINAKKDFLNKAYDIYTSLCLLPHYEKMPDDTVFDNEELISHGFYGRFCYFGILNDYTNSTIQVYECAVMFPHEAIKLFDSSFFPKIDCSQLSELCENLYRIKHYKPLEGIYRDLPPNMAKPLIEMQIEKYKDSFNNVLITLKKDV